VQSRESKGSYTTVLGCCYLHSPPSSFNPSLVWGNAGYERRDQFRLSSGAVSASTLLSCWACWWDSGTVERTIRPGRARARKTVTQGSVASCLLSSSSTLCSSPLLLCSSSHDGEHHIDDGDTTPPREQSRLGVHLPRFRQTPSRTPSSLSNAPHVLARTRHGMLRCPSILPQPRSDSDVLASFLPSATRVLRVRPRTPADTTRPRSSTSSRSSASSSSSSARARISAALRPTSLTRTARGE
jgi:hypothetical protein